MAITVNIHEAQTHLSQLLDRVRMGEEVIIAEAGQPIARLVPIFERLVERVPGSAAGQVIIPPDFDAPLPEDILEAFG